MGSFNGRREKTEVEWSGRVGSIERFRPSTPANSRRPRTRASLTDVHVVFLGMERRGDKLQSTSGDMDEVSANFAEKSSVKSVIKARFSALLRITRILFRFFFKRNTISYRFVIRYQRYFFSSFFSHSQKNEKNDISTNVGLNACIHRAHSLLIRLQRHGHNHSRSAAAIIRTNNTIPFVTTL